MTAYHKTQVSTEQLQQGRTCVAPQETLCRLVPAKPNLATQLPYKRGRGESAATRVVTTVILNMPECSTPAPS